LLLLQDIALNCPGSTRSAWRNMAMSFPLSPMAINYANHSYTESASESERMICTFSVYRPYFSLSMVMVLRGLSVQFRDSGNPIRCHGKSTQQANTRSYRFSYSGTENGSHRIFCFCLNLEPTVNNILQWKRFCIKKICCPQNFISNDSRYSRSCHFYETFPKHANPELLIIHNSKPLICA